jgi:hypothetical protein
MLTLLTPTGDRIKAFELCKRWMKNQTFRGIVKWIVVDDGSIKVMPPEDPKWIVEYIPLPSSSQNTQARNMRKGLEYVIPDLDKLVIIEDDDYYAPDWLETVSDKLNQYDLVGETNSYYYNVRTKAYLRCNNINHASLCATAMTGEALKIFIKICSSKPKKFIDMELWKAYPKRHLFHSSKVIGIKGMPGRGGIGVGHSIRASRGRALGDPEGKMLRSLIGDDAEAYLNDSVT